MNLEHLKNLSLPPLWLIEKTLAEKSLISFTELVFSILEPGRRWVNNWHTDAIADHLTACVPRPVYKTDIHGKFILDENEDKIISYFTKAEIDRLIINIPPGCTKSLLLCVMFPAWIWGPLNFPQLRSLFLSYGQKLSIRDSVYCRIIIESLLYQEYWGNNFSLRDDQNQKIRYSTDKGGFRIASSFDGEATGERVDILAIDDPINVKDTLKPLQTKVIEVNNIYDTALTSRFMPETGSGILCMQRCAVNDLSGHVLAKEMGWEHLCIPNEYEKINRSKTSLHFIDPREEKDELLIPNRIDEKETKRLKKDLGAYAYSAQYQQEPVSKDGAMFDISKFQIAKSLPSNKTHKLIMAIRYWDKAGTKDGGAYTAGTLMILYIELSSNEKVYYIYDVVRGQWEARQREPIIKQNAENDSNMVPKGRYRVWVEQEPGSGGKESAQRTISNLSGFSVYADRVTGSKEIRSEPYSVQVEAGVVYLVSAHWTSAFLDEHKNYGVGRYKDQVDSAAGAFNKLSALKIARAF